MSACRRWVGAFFLRVHAHCNVFDFCMQTAKLFSRCVRVCVQRLVSSCPPRRWRLAPKCPGTGRRSAAGPDWRTPAALPPPSHTMLTPPPTERNTQKKQEKNKDFKTKIKETLPFFEFFIVFLFFLDIQCFNFKLPYSSTHNFLFINWFSESILNFWQQTLNL